MKKSQAGFVVWGLTYFLYTSALITGIIIADQTPEHQAVVTQEDSITSTPAVAAAKHFPEEM